MDDAKTEPMSNNKGFGSVDDQLKENQSFDINQATLTLEDGQIIEGYSFGAECCVSGEVVFNTGMVGYPESLTDPSYSGQILVLTYPLIGNYGVPSEDELDEYGLHKHFESDCIQITALIVSDYSFDHSHHEAMLSLSSWLIKHKIPALYNIDTRMLTKKLRVKGSMLGKIEFNNLPKIKMINPYKINLVAKVSRSQPQDFGKSDDKLKIIAIDCGIKNNIIRYLCGKGVYLKVVPWDYDFNNEPFDGLFISNGPGDPEMATTTVNNIRKFMNQSSNKCPLFGICLGNQILALAAGGKTYKMKFGNRGMNQPVIDLRTSRCYITPQNHGFAVDEESLKNKDFTPFFRNANDNSNEGIIHQYKPWFSVQFHPEAQGGPTDTEFLFDMFLSRIKNKNYYEVTTLSTNMTHILCANNNNVEKVLLLGSGGLSIGQAGEFDYSGSQAIKALKEENIKIILINPNIATVQTSSNMADEVYFVPVTPEYVTRIIEKERPDGILLQFGGQTALNCGIELEKNGILEYYNCKVLGTPIKTIEMTEDRKLFAEKLKEVNEKVAPSACATNIKEAIKVAQNIGYPILLRSAFALGGLGSGFADNDLELKQLANKAFANCDQVIIDKSLKGWKEVEYEVVRDINDNCITVCNMENFDPLGIHTGDSIVVAPSQTLSNNEYYMLRSAAIKIVRHLGVIGECNIQYALDPHSNDYCVIEVNARLSRSSALASKATGYPLAYVAAKLALNKTLTSIKNSITKATQACFEPSLDYCVVKIPRWDLKKFETNKRGDISFKLGSAMKSVGEVMAIDRKFEAAFSKALRMVNDNCDGFGFVPEKVKKLTDEQLIQELINPSDIRVFVIAEAFNKGYTVNKIHNLTKIDKWFLCKLRNIMITEKIISTKYKSLDKLDAKIILKAKKYGFSDQQIARILNESHSKDDDQVIYTKITENDVRHVRINKFNITPWVKQIDTLAAEFPAYSNYLYVTYNGSEHDLEFNETGIIVLGCGAYRIGSSCEFDWCAVSCIRTVNQLNNELEIKQINRNNNNNKNQKYKKYNKKYIPKTKNLKNNKIYSSIVINYNPETVSTDYDECDRMYFEELSYERVLDIYEIEENCRGIIVSVGGQISNNLAIPLHNAGCKILGTQPDNIDCAENRHRFSKLLDDLHIDQPLWCEARTEHEAHKFSKRVGYPVLIRPSYVLSGAAMNVSYNSEQLGSYLTMATEVSRDHPVVISKFILRAKEIEFDAVANNGQILNYAISEHIENAGVHSGDATLVLPAQNLYTETFKRIKDISRKISYALSITGPFNIQFLCKDNCIKVIECNLRASRSFPFVSKTFNINFIELATKSMVLGNNYDIKPVNFNLDDMDFVCVKSPMFSFTRLDGADPVLRVEMASTGEVACFGDNKYEAFIKSIVSAGYKLPIPNPTKSTTPTKLRLDYIYNDLQKINNKLLPSTSSTIEQSPSPSASPNNESQDADDHSLSFNYESSPFGSPRLKNQSSSSTSDLFASNLKYFKSANLKNLYRSNILLSIGPQKCKYSFVDCALSLKQMGFTLYATENTYDFYKTHNIETILVTKPSSGKTPNIINLIESGKIHFVLNIPGKDANDQSKVSINQSDGFQIRRKSIDFNVPLISNIKLAKLFVRSLAKKYLKSYENAFDDEFLHIKSWNEYMQSTKTKYRTTTNI